MAAPARALTFVPASATDGEPDHQVRVWPQGDGLKVVVRLPHVPKNVPVDVTVQGKNERFWPLDDFQEDQHVPKNVPLDVTVQGKNERFWPLDDFQEDQSHIDDYVEELHDHPTPPPYPAPHRLGNALFQANSTSRRLNTLSGPYPTATPARRMFAAKTLPLPTGDGKWPGEFEPRSPPSSGWETLHGGKPFSRHEQELAELHFPLGKTLGE